MNMQIFNGIKELKERACKGKQLNPAASLIVISTLRQVNKKADYCLKTDGKLLYIR